MAPSPQAPSLSKMDPAALNGDAVVISGMSGMYPEARNIQELSDILYNKVNPINADEPRWKFAYPELPDHLGKAPELSAFDAQFFKVHYRLGRIMDPMSRKLLEQTFQALYDAGISPGALENKDKIGVFVGSGTSETDKSVFYSQHIKGLGLIGCCKTMFPNRISYWLNLRGPSINIDAACASSMVALQRAYEAIKTGQCEAAIVGGSNICLHAQTSVGYQSAIDLCMDGKTKSFDKCADGCARGDAITILFLQKAKDAKRVYAEVCYIKSEYSSSLPGTSSKTKGPNRDPVKLATFIKGFYDEAGVSPSEVEYVEAFGSANSEADKNELEALDKVLCKNRTNPLLVGSVISNIGYSEAATGTSAITKVLLGYQRGKLAGNLNCVNPRDDIEALRCGKMRIVTDTTHFNRSYVAVNNMSLFGMNVHALLNGHFKPKNLLKYKTEIPYLITISGRQESAVSKIMNELKSNPLDAEQIGLLHNIHEHSISGHLGRGFCILATNDEGKTVSLAEKNDYCDDAVRPLWFVYSGMGSQWAGMGVQLMRIPVFAAAIERCHKALEPKGIDIVHIITTEDKSIFDDILNSFVGIAAIQIGLTDVLRKLGLVPDNIIGHSVGELGCAYADGCMTLEETILSSYSRGLVSKQTPFIHGSMAAVGLGYKQILDMCPPEIQVACHNSADSSTISGPSGAMQQFVAKLTAQGIFAKEVPCSNIAYHSRYIQEAGPGLLKYLREVIKTPKLRTKRWLSTSIPENRWEDSLAKYSSAEYHTNNLLNPVLFEETAIHIPPNAVLVEVAPHGLLQAILRRSLPSSCINVPLTRRGHADNTVFLLEAIGQLYMEGYNPKLQALYPPIEYPVSTETPGLSHLIEWAHLEKWSLPLERDSNRRTSASATFHISVHDDEYHFLRGNVHENETLFPFSGVLVCVWDTLAMSIGAPLRQTSVRFSNLHLHAQPRLLDDEVLRLSVQITKGNGYFEVTHNNVQIASGEILPINPGPTAVYRETINPSHTEYTMTQEDIYKIFHGKGSYYKGEFRSIKHMNDEMSRAQMSWDGNWIALIDSLIQFRSLRCEYNGMAKPRFIQRVTINAHEHNRSKPTSEDCIDADFIDDLDATRCAGVLIENIKFRDILPSVSNRLHLKQLSSPRKIFQSSIDWNHNITLRSTKYGDLNTVHWEQAVELDANDLGVKVIYAGLNVRDAKKASGLAVPHEINEDDLGYGMDFSGVTDNSVRVMGVVRGGSASTRVAADPAMLWPVPEHWSLEDAATVPLPYAYAFYCLAIKANLTPGMKILVNGATGALGLAIISIALAHDCIVFATVCDAKKKHFLRKIYPAIPEDHIGNSRDASFCDMVLLKTKGEGCQVVICTLEGQLKNEAMNCCASSGVVLDTTQVVCMENFTYGMYNLTRARNYSALDFSGLFDDASKKDLKLIQIMVSEGISKGYVRPLCRVTYAAQESARALKLLSSSQHRGRVLLHLDQNSAIAVPRLTVSSKGSHLVVDATNNDTVVGHLIDGLVVRGARNILLNRQQAYQRTNGYMRFKIKKWENLGVQVKVSTEKLVDNEKALALLRRCNDLGSIEGVYFLTDTSQKGVPTILAYLDVVTRNISSIKCFAVINELSNIGQDICEKRVNDGFPATMLTLPKINKFDDESVNSYCNQDKGLSLTEAVEALEIAVKVKCAAVAAEVKLLKASKGIDMVTKSGSVSGRKDIALLLCVREERTA
ncbi:hypothetical protein JYU34_012033 [Plutella xylostella]|uniref:Ketosynthase family 3 (KS3) domain-containing protein n=1 Tax=Plutella xylostella TaxID=51655 RepID=A0ABQ7QE60_PLUXY|nr:hypothetical protein JYU34_012033 [Plutella xylostella]